jgi:hypothetical protein
MSDGKTIILSPLIIFQPYFPQGLESQCLMVRPSYFRMRNRGGYPPQSAQSYVGVTPGGGRWLTTKQNDDLSNEN